VFGIANFSAEPWIAPNIEQIKVLAGTAPTAELPCGELLGGQVPAVAVLATG
jgi:hypothetical protein